VEQADWACILESAQGIGFSHCGKSRCHQSSQRLKPDLHAPVMPAGNGLLHPTHSASAGVRSRVKDGAVNESQRVASVTSLWAGYSLVAYKGLLYSMSDFLPLLLGVDELMAG